MAFTTTTGWRIVLRTVRTTIGMPQPWQSECPPRNGCTRAGSARWSSDETLLTSQSDVGGSRSGEDRAYVGRVQVAAAEAVDVSGESTSLP